jgi:DNA-binding MarR family transcriptional regulator
MYEKLAEKSVGKRIQALFRLSMINFRSEMKRLGFGTGDYDFMGALFLDEGLSQDELSRRIRVDKSYTARTLARLEKAGMVERRPDPEEHRIKRVFLGKKALDHKLDFFNILMGWHKILVDDIAADDLDIVRTSMDKMITNAEAYLGLGEIKK